MSDRRFNPDNYIDTQERIDRFWVEHPNGAIRTNLMSDPGDFSQCRYVAKVYKDASSSEPDATGYAFEVAGTAGANRTSHEENCETSAIGRALANMGYAKSREDRPSKQEMTKVNAAPRAIPDDPSVSGPPTSVADTQRMRRLHAVAKDRGLSHDDLHAITTGRGKASLKDLNPTEMDTFTNWLEKVTPPNLQAAIDTGRADAK